MIEISIYRNENKIICKYVVSGHADYEGISKTARFVIRLFSRNRGSAGFDTICASVSTIAQSVILGLKDVLDIRPGLEIEDGYLECIIPDNLDISLEERVNVLLETMYLSFKNIEEQYPDYVEVREMEV